MDLLAQLYRKHITFEDAQKLFDKELELPGDWREKFMFDNFEATAYAHGGNLNDIARFRYEGWPKYCAKCGKYIDYKAYGWWLKFDNKEQPILMHIEC